MCILSWENSYSSLNLAMLKSKVISDYAQAKMQAVE